jgi:hypothetical protein
MCEIEVWGVPINQYQTFEIVPSTKDDDPNGSLHISVDNGYTAYVNGVEMGSSEDWTHTDTFSFSSDCNSPLVVAVDAYDLGGTASIIASIEHCGKTGFSNR